MKKFIFPLITVCMLTSLFSCTQAENSGISVPESDITVTVAQETVQLTDTPVTTEPVVSETTVTQTEKPYKQYYPVTPYQKKYAEFLTSPDISYNLFYMVHLNNDTIPEIIALYGTSGAVYSIDNDEVYEISRIYIDTYSMEFWYRPYLNMIMTTMGSVMYGDRHEVIYTFSDEIGRLELSEEIHITDPSSLHECDLMHITGYENTIMYDIGEELYEEPGESWKLPDENSLITESRIQYWLNN